MPAKRLYILRHAKAAEADRGEQDAARPLAPRGHEDAAKLAHWWQKTGQQVDAAYISTSVRTRETYAHLRETLGVEAQADDRLYLASPGDLLAYMHHLPDAENSALLLGHNPGLHQLAVVLAEPASLAAASQTLAYMFPTCAMVVLEGPESWEDWQPQSARISHYWDRHLAG